MNFLEKLDFLMSKKKLNKSTLSRACGIPYTTIDGWYKKGYDGLKLSSLKKLSAFFNVSLDYWVEPDAMGQEHIRAVRIPVLGFVRAGIPIEAVEDILDYEEISTEMARQGDYFALSIKGTSMEPKISEGDVVIVRCQESAENGDLAVVLINGNDATVKRFYKTTTGIKLVSSNPAYEPFYFSPEEVDSLPVRVIGKVVELRAKF